MYLKIIQWYASGDTGLSSKHMAAVAAGAKGDGSYPHDPHDLGRCIRLVETVPEIKERFPIIANTTKEWAIVIANWDELCSMYSVEYGPRGKFIGELKKSNKCTYTRMKNLGL